MKHLALALLLATLIHQQCSNVFVKAGDGFIRTRRVHFMLNGSPYYANGFNAYWLMYVAADPSERFKVSTAFREATSHGLTVARTWAFSDGGYRPLQYSPGSYNEEMFKGLDFVISEARKYGIKLILSLVNNYESFGGKKQYVNWARNQGQYLTSDDDFFRNPIAKGYYRNHIRTVLSRYNSFTGIHYKDDPTIMAWELMNEPRCTSDPSGGTIQAWITEMASNLTSSANNRIPGIDFATAHCYPDQWVSSSNDQAQLSFLNNWLQLSHPRCTICSPEANTSHGIWKIIERSRFQLLPERSVVQYCIPTKYTHLLKEEDQLPGGLFWQLLTEGMDNFGDGYEIVLSQGSSTANVIAQQSHKAVPNSEDFCKG
ncbi:Mannan endo-1,4-beta-mannosidase-like protein [Quillaja saponaria]|uniref:mannan endo-1,4-beta-mannosidase n=1 Tax=Quillaja saponaria TaxID=32244 RepID=A0AAD7L977_QUISA|nr:Mannan endo-1,4-beta-mannosidase-like protein [Quillaja saponaria]